MQKISKTAAAYLVGGIAIIQLAPVFFNTFPPEDLLGINKDALMQSLFIFVAIGFPLVLILTYLFSSKEDSSSNNKNKQITASGDYKQKIAVIPFTNLNKDEDGAFLVDGIVEDLITEFSMISEIEIVSRQTCFNLRDENLSHGEYREKYELDYIVSGSIRAVENRLRISVELSETPDGNVIWSNKYDRVKEDIFDIQDEIVRKITIALLGGIEISSLKRAHRKPTESMTSYEFLLKGKDNHHKFTKEANDEAMKSLDLAISADENNAQAYAWKACVIGQALGRGYCEMSDDKVGELLGLLDKALEVDKNDFECHRMLSEVYLSMHDFEKSKESGQKAASINPNDPRVISVYGEALLRLRELDSGIEYLEKAYELDPIPQGQTTSDRRLAALFLGYYLKEDFEKCQAINAEILNIDVRTWLLNFHLHQIQSIDCSQDNWFIKGIKEFDNLDWKMEIDRFHLNNDELNNELMSVVQFI
ncbi:MAG: adenylate/guanylate cyclase domain-containing protein [Gammaproteobacteria bacterium]